MRFPRTISPGPGAAALLALALAAAPSAGALLSTEIDRSRYDVIEAKMPFGPPPPKPKTQEELDEEARLRALAEQAAQEAAQEETAEIIPDGLDKIKVTLLSRYRGVSRVGFVDGSQNKTYSLFEGESFEDFRCDEIDIENRTVKLSRAGKSARLPIWVNPATTNRGDVTSFGQPGGRPVAMPDLKVETDWESEQRRAAARDRAEEIKARREQARLEREERRRQHEEEWAAMTPEQRERRMQDTAVECIINGDPPPPIELDDVSMAKLEEAGFDTAELRSRPSTRRGRPGGRRGGPGGGGGPPMP